MRRRICYIGPAMLLAAGLGLTGAGPASGSPQVLSVGPGQTYSRPCAAIAAAHPGDTIAIDARGNGSYDGDVCAWSTNGLTIVGVNGRAHIDAAGQNSQGKAIWVIGGDHTVIRDIELSGAAVPDGNGAGIRQEGAGLELDRVWLHDNQEGILAGANPASDIVIDSSVLSGNGAGDGYSHNVYIGHVRSFTMRYSYSTDAHVGHLVKSRADTTYLLYDRFSGEAGSDSYEVDLPNGGDAYLIGTVVQQGRNTQNPNMVAFGEEGPLSGSRLVAVNDTFVNDLGSGAALMVAPGVNAPSVVRNDISVGSPVLVTQATAQLDGNCVTTDPGFIDAATFDYHLSAASPCRAAGVAPGSVGGVDLTPVEQYVHPGSHEDRADGGAIPGAFGTSASPAANGAGGGGAGTGSGIAVGGILGAGTVGGGIGAGPGGPAAGCRPGSSPSGRTSAMTVSLQDLGAGRMSVRVRGIRGQIRITADYQLLARGERGKHWRVLRQVGRSTFRRSMTSARGTVVAVDADGRVRALLRRHLHIRVVLTFSVGATPPATGSARATTTRSALLR